MKKYSFLSLVAVTLISIAACNNASQTASSTPKQDSATKPAAQTATADDVDPLPNLFQIGGIFKNAELTYSAGMTADIKDAAHFNTLFEQALNLGVYSADLSYATINKQKDPVNKYMKVVKDISDAMGLGSVFSSDQIAKRFEANINNDDSLTAIVGDLQIKTDELLSKNKQNNVRVIIYSGAWAESMYIASNVYAKNKNANASNHVIEQITILENILKVMQKYQSTDAHLGSLYKDMKAIDDQYNAFSEVKNYNPSSNQSLVLTTDDISKLAESAKALRTKILAEQLG